MADTYRWTLGEYVLRCEDATGLKEVVVEGALDRDIIADAVGRWGVLGVSIIHIDDVLVGAEAENSYGTTASGVRENLVALALALEKRAAETVIAANLALIADRDSQPPAAVSRFLLVTDGYSMENYALNERSFDRFGRMVLGRAKPSGSGVTATNTWTGRELFDRVVAPSIGIAAIRLALRSLTPPLAPFAKWITKYLDTDTDGKMNLKSELLVERILQRHGQTAKRAEVEAARNSGVESARADPVRVVRGHDYVEILHHLFKTPWGRRIAGETVKSWSEPVLARVLLLATPPEMLDETPLFRSLRSRLTKA